MNSRRSNIAVALLLAVVAGWLLRESGKLVFGTVRVPQTAFFPTILAALLMIFSIALLVQAFRQDNSGAQLDRIDAQGWFRIGATLVTLVGYALFLERLGFLLTTFLLMVLLLRAVEPQGWSRVGAIALATSFAAYFVFAWLLQIPLPAGLLGF